MDIETYISSGIIEAYVMGLASEEEVQILQCIQKNNATVREAIIAAELAMEKLATAQSVAPPAHLKSDIWAAIQKNEAVHNDDLINEEVIEISIPSETENTSQTEKVIFEQITSSKSDIRIFKPWAMAASVLLLVVGAYSIYSFQRQNDMQENMAILEKNAQNAQIAYTILDAKWALINNPNMHTILLAGVEKHPDMKAVVLHEKTTNQTYLSLENLPPAPAGQQYQLWAIIDGKPVDAGVYTESTLASFQKMKVIENAQAFAITLEKSGGSAAPTMEQMYVMGKV